MTGPQGYTTAIIAAVPAADDPVHEVVAEDAHVTLQFLGEAAELSEEQVTQIKQTLEMLASVVYPFPVDVSGTAELGPQQAQVLIVQSALLTKLRETLGMSEAVSTAVASAQQFPNWIPHLTLAYEGEMPDVSAYKQVTLGSIELWLAEEQISYPLNAPQPVTAAGEKVFEEGLHPRGADGRFIEKFGVIKYLSGLSWKYGKVEGIYHDKHTGAVKLTVTPSDLSGKTSGTSVTLSPKQVYHAPQSKAHLTITDIGVQKTGGQGGSNPGGSYSMPNVTSPTGGTVDYYVKKPKSKSHGNNEALANALYEETGVPVPAVDYHADGNLYSKIVKGQQDMSSQLNNPEWTDQVRRNFAVDAWLGNRDVFGLTYDNILTDEHGTPWRIDNGGALLYRAMGEKKTDFGGQVTELDVFRQGKKAKIYGPGMTKAQELDGAERVLAISPGQIEDMVSAHNLPKSLADTLKARRVYIASYYGLPLPESQVPDEAEGPTTAPLVDAPDIAENQGKSRNWFKTALTHLGFIGQAGDMVEFPDGSTQLLGVDDTGNALSVVGEQAQQLGFLQKHGADAPIYLKKSIDPATSRPAHGSTLAGADLSQQRWKRGDQVIDSDGVPWKVLGWNDSTGAVLVQFANKDPVLLDTFGKDSTGLWKVERWDPPAVDTPLETGETIFIPATDLANNSLGDLLNQHAGNPPQVETPAEPVVTPPVPNKTGQAAVAEAQIKADLDQPMPTGNGTPPPPKQTSAPGGAKEMVIGDGTTAVTGDSVTSKKDGKTYTFVKPKGQYAVVTDPNADDPNKQLLKLASTMTQPGKATSVDTTEIEKPKTATGEVPALGMMAEAKDGWSGEITLISPDGKFVFITDANGKRKRKSTGTVSITSAPQGVPEAPKVVAGPIKTYGQPPVTAWTGEEKSTGYLAADAPQMHAGLMVHVGYADGSHGLEPYSGQPIDSLEINSQGKIAVFGDLPGYLGPVASTQLATAGQANNKATTYQVVYTGNIFYTDGTTGPNGGLSLWYPDDNDAEAPGTDAFELSPTDPVTLTVIGSEPITIMPLTLPSGTAFQPFDGEANLPAYPPLYGDEAKTLTDWKGQLSVGQEISLDGHNWMEIQAISPSGSVKVSTSNGAEAFINPWSSATFAVKAPQLTDGDVPDPAFAQPTPPDLVPDELPVSTGTKKIKNLVHGDVIIDGNGDTSIIDTVSDVNPSTQDVLVKALDENFGSPADPEFAFTHLGNLTEGPMSVPIGTIAPHLYPGAKVELSPGQPYQVVSYPDHLANGNHQFAAIPVGNPEAPILVTVGDAEGMDIAGSVPLPVHLDSFASAQEAGADTGTINALFDTAKVQPQEITDHHAQMTDAGIPFGTAGYPIYYGTQSDTYFRAGQTGMQEWDPEAGAWNNVGGTVTDKTKVWDGVPFEGSLTLPEGFPAKILADPNNQVLNYQPKPGEIIQAAKMDIGGQKQTVLISYSQGLDGPAHIVMGGGAEGVEPHPSNTPFQTGWQTSGSFTDITTIHDPFAEAVDTPQLPHHEGPQPPAELGAKLQSLGFTPDPGAQLFYAKIKEGTANLVFLKGDDGRYRRIGPNGTMSASNYALDELVAPDFFGDGHFDIYTYTYLPTGTDAPSSVEGLPEGFAPYVPGEGQSVLKVTLPNGKQNVYLQKQPGAGWYEMGPDGVVLEHSDAVKSDFAVQQKLAGKGSQAAKYDLLHPLPEGSTTPATPVPTLTNAKGSFTPEPHQSVVALVSHDNDPDPWFYVQDEPGGMWTPAPGMNTGAPLDDEGIQAKLATGVKNGLADGGWKKVYDGQTGQAAVDAPDKTLPPSFTGYIPKEGEQVFEEPNGSHWVLTPDDSEYHPVNDDGTLDTAYGIPQASFDAEGVNQVWPVPAASAPETAPATPAQPQTFNGYTPDDGEKVVQVGAGDAPGKHFYVQQAPGEQWKLIGNDGQPTLSSPISPAMMDQALEGTPGVNQVFPPVVPGGVFGGYQSQAGDAVLQMAYPNGDTKLVVKPEGAQNWQIINPDGSLGDPDLGYSQDTLEWAQDDGGYTITELQGTLKPGPVTAPEPLDTSGPAYAGVAAETVLTPGSFNFGSYAPNAAQQNKLLKMPPLQPGESVYVTEDASLPGGSTSVFRRTSSGNWHTVYVDGSSMEIFADDTEAEGWLNSNNYVLHKAQFTAPAAGPAPVSTGPKAQLSGWAAKDIPNPETFSYVESPDTVSAKAGSYVFIQGSPNSGGNGGGLIAQLSEDWNGTDYFQANQILPVQAGGVISPGSDWIKPNGDAFSLTFTPTNNYYFSGDGVPGLPPAVTPTGPSAPAAPEQVLPSYPGQHKPSQEDINAWGGSLTKDGHIPTPGMYVTGKGPMSGKIVSVSKDKSKAVVLTSDGKKTTRLIEALKTDLSANYSAYAAPVTAKDIPSGMPLAVDTVAEALDKTAKDGKFRAILNGHPGVSGGQMVVTKTTAPSGKVFNRVHLTLTPDQRAQLVASLSGTGEKGDWVKKSKQSDQVAIGDQLPMRKSSQDNPDGTPRWKVDPETKPPTHTVTKVEDDPSGSGVKIVTMKNVTTGEEITSRFHAGKSLSIYTWDPNKPKVITGGAFSLSAVAKAQGWQQVKDGGISAITGGADNGKLYHEPGTAVSKSAMGQIKGSWDTLRNVSADGVVIEMVDPKGPNTASSTGVTVVSVPEGVDETALGAALAKMGIDYRPMNQDDAKTAVRGTLRTLLSLDTSDVDTPKHYTDDQLFAQAGKTMGINDLGWQDVLVGVDESTGKTSFFWSDRARNALAAKASYNAVYRAASTGTAAQIVSTVKYGSASSILKKTTGMLDGSGSVGNGASASHDNGNHAGHGSYASAASHNKLPASNKFASYKSPDMMIYHRPEAVLGRIMDYRVAASDAFGMGQGQGADHLKHATSMSQVKDYFLGGGLPTEAVAFVAVKSAAERDKAIAQLKADGFAMINGRPVEDIVITLQKAVTLSPNDMPPVTLPANARPILDLPVSYDAPAPAAGATGGEAAA